MVVSLKAIGVMGSRSPAIFCKFARLRACNAL
jgi:hypothetical protein